LCAPAIQDALSTPGASRQGGQRRYTGIARDLSERKQALEQINLFFALSLDILAIWTVGGYFTRVSPAFSKTLGWSAEEIKARSIVEFVHPDDRAATIREIEKMASTGENVLQFENRYLHKDGSIRRPSPDLPHQALLNRLQRRQGKSALAQILLQLFNILKKRGMQPHGLCAGDVFLQVVDEQSLVRGDAQLLYRVQVNSRIGFDNSQVTGKSEVVELGQPGKARPHVVKHPKSHV